MLHNVIFRLIYWCAILTSFKKEKSVSNFLTKNGRRQFQKAFTRPTSGRDDDVAEEDVSDHAEDEDDAVEREEDPPEKIHLKIYQWLHLEQGPIPAPGSAAIIY